MDENDLSSIGFMFDAGRDKVNQAINLPCGIVIKVKCIDGNPGHVQSGNYLWPAASSAGEHIVTHWSHLKSVNVLEFGAGCGLSGLAASLMEGVKRVVFTDHDYSSLELIAENIQLNKRENCYYHLLSWGEKIPNDLRVEYEYPEEGFDLIIGADLIYCVEVVGPLFSSTNELLSKNGVFLLVCSFTLSEETEIEIDIACKKANFIREEIQKLNESKSICRIEYYRRT